MQTADLQFALNNFSISSCASHGSQRLCCRTVAMQLQTELAISSSERKLSAVSRWDVNVVAHAYLCSCIEGVHESTARIEFTP